MLTCSASFPQPLERMRNSSHGAVCSAAFGNARIFSPLCFTESGFNSDSAQHPAGCSALKQPHEGRPMMHS
ncbi:hypothetical protein SKAU_G00344200 [Synaphobranchus kaupii]|uniref:Uncharacterized protein n=1 Tax=Synaphobranchus kaupii TaxID=118154 RepID=A0A9Q1EJ79_SYNKA|nr:hypothetical protein SKAU_G00344200 [Synaphobranchus kaupii]